WLHVDVRQSRYMRRTTARWKNSKRMEDLEYPAATLLVTPSGICDLPSPPYNPVSSLCEYLYQLLFCWRCRDYEKETARRATVEEFYRVNHIYQTYDFVS
ncbi:hypothetical protein GW17_00035402, partial [Ensete ventricosum]